MTDWNNPSTSQTHSNELAATKGRDESNAVMDYSSDSNIPDGTIRWNATAQRFEIWDATGASWNELVSKYLINVDQLDGRDAGNANGNIPISNGTLNTNLNADQLDGEHGTFYDDAPNGTKMVFYQASAPTGWNQDTSVNDRVLQVTSGSGGGTGGSWTISGLTQGSLSVNGHTLAESEIPSHTHGSGTLSTSTNGSHNHGGSTGGNGGHNHSLNHIDGDLNGSAKGTYTGNDVGSTGTSSVGNHSHSIGNDGNHSHSVNSGSTGSAGGNGSHSHGLSGSPGHDGSWRPNRIDVIVATRSK